MNRGKSRSILLSLDWITPRLANTYGNVQWNITPSSGSEVLSKKAQADQASFGWAPASATVGKQNTKPPRPTKPGDQHPLKGGPAKDTQDGHYK